MRRFFLGRSCFDLSVRYFDLVTFIRLCAVVLAALWSTACATDRQVSVSPATLAVFQQDELKGVYRVEGYVSHPGVFSIKRGETLKLSEVLRRAGGTGLHHPLDEGADLRHIRVRRLQNGGVIEFRLDVWHGDGGDFVIKPGDLIDVPESVF